MTEQKPDPRQAFEDHAPTPVRPKFVRQLGQFSAGLLVAALLLFVGGLFAKNQSDNIRNSQLTQLTLVEGRIQQELIVLNSPPAETIQPLGLKALLSLGQQVSQQNKGFQWLGSLHNQTLQVLLTQAIEALSRPVAGIDSSEETQRQLEAQLRLDTLPKLAQLKNHIAQATNGYLVLLFGLGTLLAAIGLSLGFHWFTHRKTLALSRRIQMLSRALHSQQENDQKREGAHAALEGVLKALNSNQQLEHRGTLMQIGQQLEELNQSGRAVLQFAKSFHQLSNQGTQVVKSTLNSEQRNAKAENHMEIMQIQLEGLRSDIRSAAQGLRKAGEVSRQLLGRLDASQMELTLTEPENSRQLQQLVEQSQQALKESIEGLVLASQKINMGQNESNKLAEYMAVNQTAWSNLLSQVEQVAESASQESESALRLAKRLMNKSQQPIQAAKAPPQLLP
ncbi:MAG: hypothetical protein KJ798_06205 [Gammaproteobacteria bacterium]|nr:hypothetical protein [Gammaproteobacteria bacterium]MBU0848001.1 hypothetical protein [Gammaproteobacteria bacterium]MBU1268879.1 hypothetical protein [Gammaproteobacteria bacterium]MBU1529787.1 hypothetical protein [Gammaproteobacteria bacterium]MBU1779962.1 hypothetical protein [Gammaproteobacteria bacterium]